MISVSVCLLSAFLVPSTPVVGQALVQRDVGFACDGGEAERPYLLSAEPDRVNFTVPWEGPFRFAEQGWQITYKLPVPSAAKAIVGVRVGNRFQVSASRDGRAWEVILREGNPATSLSNLAWREADLARFLGGEFVYLKLEHGLPDHPGFGGCIFDLRLKYEAPDRALPLATGGPARLAVAVPVACAKGEFALSGTVAQPVEGEAVRLEVYPDAGNPTLARADLRDGAFTAKAVITKHGPGKLVVALLDGAGNDLERVVVPYDAPAPEVPPLIVTLRQPYYTDEADVEARINVREDLRAGALQVRLSRDGAVLATQDLTPGPEALSVSFPLADLAEGDYILTITLTGRGGDVVAQQHRAIHRLSPNVHPSRVEIRPGGITYLNGQPFLPLIFHLAGASEEASRAGNTVLFGGEDPEACATELDKCAAQGLMAMPHLCGLLRGRNDFDGIRATVSRNKNHPALLAWYVADEPEGTGDAPELLQKARDVIREVDPLHPIAGLNNEPSVFAAYAPGFDVHLADPYPIPLSPISQVADWTEASRKACGPDKPTWMCLQTHDLSLYGVQGGRWPTAEELRCMEYLALIHGAKGIAWWAYGHARDHNWDTYRAMAAELKGMEPYLLSTEGTGGVSVDFDKATVPELHASAHRLGDRLLVLLANPGPATTVRLQVKGMSASRAARLFDYDVTPLSASGFEVSLPQMGTAAWVIE